MRPARYLFHAQIAGIVKRRVALRFNEGQLVQNGVAVARLVQKKLRARVEGY